MHDDDTDTPTADQAAWEELSQVIRGQLAKYAQRMPEMSVEELKEFVETCRDALFFEWNAHDFDNEVDRAGRQLFNSDD